MGRVLICHCLYDITFTGVRPRNKPTPTESVTDWIYKRNTQCNFDTLVQTISLRAQPENITEPIKSEIMLNSTEYFGYMILHDRPVSCWSFTFDVGYADVFRNEQGEFGALYADCENVPMLKCGTELHSLPDYLTTTKEYRNIVFYDKKD